MTHLQETEKMAATDPTDSRLDADVIRVLAGPRVPKFLATRDAQGVPNVVPVLSLAAVDEHTIVFGEMMVWKTRRNLEADPRLSMLVVSPDLRAWTVRGRFVEFQRSGPLFDRVSSEESARYNPYGSYRSAGVIEVLGTTRVSRFSQLGLLLDTVRCRMLARSVSRDGPTAAMPVQVREKFRPAEGGQGDRRPRRLRPPGLLRRISPHDGGPRAPAVRRRDRA